MYQVRSGRSKEKKSDQYPLKYPNPFPAVVTTRSHSKTLMKIKDHLTPSQLKLFRQTCFGSFLDVPPIRFSGVLTHSMLLREVDKEDALDQEMWFNVGGHYIRFSRIEFALVTGFRFSGNTKIWKWIPGRDKHQFRERYFPGEEDVKYKDFESLYLSTVFKKIPDEEAVKLSLVYLLTFLFIGTDRRKTIPNEILQLVEYIPRFNKYPWGSYIWRLTYGYLSKALQNKLPKDSEELDSTGVTYVLLGFPYAFQVILI